MAVLKIEFYLRFYTRPGQSLYISGNIAALGGNDPSKAVSMQYLNGEFWHAHIELEDWPVEPVSYNYILQTEEGKRSEEWGNDRVLEEPAPDIEELQVVDTWNWTGEYENVFYTAPFREVLLRRTRKSKKIRSKGDVTHIFRVKAPLLQANETLCLLGSGTALKDWDNGEPVPMVQEGSWWTCRINIPKEGLPIEYKYGVYDVKEKRFLYLENGENRHLYGDAHQHKLNVVHDGFVYLPNNTWRGAGVAIPVFSLRTKKSISMPRLLMSILSRPR